MSGHLKCLVAAIVCVFILQDSSARGADRLRTKKLGFSVKYRDTLSDHEDISAFVLPGETLTLELSTPPGPEPYQVRVPRGRLERIGSNRWHWVAPLETGSYHIKISHPRAEDTADLNVFVMVPYDRLVGEYLNGYRIGQYPAQPLNGSPIYRRPRGFIEVTASTQDTKLSPHFKLKQFLSKQAGRFPKYVVLDERLPLALEMILEKVNEKGYTCETLHVMSGYRTPFYNRAIENVRYSLHQWGRAADIFVDGNGDGVMDDLDRNGRFDKGDAMVLYNIIEQMAEQKQHRGLFGGLGLYGSTAAHGPFVHVDTRPARARW